MTTKKLLFIVGGIVAALILLVVLFVGGIVGVVFYSIGNSEAAQTAKTFLRNNERLKREIGEVRDFGWFVGGNLKTDNNDGDASLNLKVIGARETVNATVAMAYKQGRAWRVTDAYYKNKSGQAVQLLDKYEPDAGAGGAGRGGGGAVEGFDEESFRAQVLEAPGPALVVVSSPKYSLDSRELEGVLDALSEDYAERVPLVKYSVEEQPLALRRFNVQTVPTVIIFKGGGERERLTGKITKRQLARALDKHLAE